MVVRPAGQLPLTGLGVALLLERLMGRDGAPGVPAGLYFRYQLLETAAYLRRFGEAGGTLRTLSRT